MKKSSFSETRRIIVLLLIINLLIIGSFSGMAYAETVDNSTHILYGESQETFTGIAKNKTTGQWEYLVNGKPDKSYTGVSISNYDKMMYFVREGKVTFDFTGLAKNRDDNTWYYFSGSKHRPGYSGIALGNDGIMYYVEKGKITFSYTGLAKNKADNTWYYFSGSKHRPNYTGIAQGSDGIMYYVERGKITFKYTGLAKNKTDNTWYYFYGSKHRPGYNGVAVGSDGIKYYVENGKITFKFQGLAKNREDNTWYYFRGSKHRDNYSGTAISSKDKQYYYCEEGKIEHYTGLVFSQDHGTYIYVKGGRNHTGYTGPSTSISTSMYYHVKNGVWSNPESGEYGTEYRYTYNKGRIVDSYIQYEGETFFVDQYSHRVKEGVVQAKDGKYTYIDPVTGQPIKSEGFVDYKGKKYYSNSDGTLKKSEVFKVDGEYYGAQDDASLAENGWAKTGELNYYYTDYKMNKICLKAKAVMDDGVESLRDMYDWSNRLPFVTFKNNPDWGSMWFANYGFIQKQGNCYVKSGTIYIMAKMKGYDIINVRISAGHAWCYVDMDGVRYIVDPSYGFMVRREVAERDKDWYTKPWTEMPILYEG